MAEAWLISAPGNKTVGETWEKLGRATGAESRNHKFPIPDLKVGTLDQLVGLSDDLAKLDTYSESVMRKVVAYFAEILEEDRAKLWENLLVGGKSVTDYVQKFSWEAAKYPVKQSLKTLAEIISKQVSQIDGDLKTKATAYNNLKNSLAAMERKATGSLLTKDLGEVVKKEDFVTESEYLSTLLVVVPRNASRDWEEKYEKLADMVVPRSSRMLFSDAEHSLFSVTLFAKVAEEYKLHCRENKFIVRDFEWDDATAQAGKNERDRLSAEKQKQFGPLVRWLKINFSEAFAAFVHVKALRVFVESVLRYGLPVNFCAALLEPTKKGGKRLKEILGQHYAHLDASQMGSALGDVGDDVPGLLQLQGQDYYPYVFFKINLDLLEARKF